MKTLGNVRETKEFQTTFCFLLFDALSFPFCFLSTLRS
jgi:hypothetical protein